VLKSYYLTSIADEGYAYILLDTETNMFATVSDWGNYACRWSAPSSEFRNFLTGLDGDYVRRYLMTGRLPASGRDGAQSKAFVEHIWPMFVALLKKELGGEKSLLLNAER
jgi:hypothetical protein